MHPCLMLGQINWKGQIKVTASCSKTKTLIQVFNGYHVKCGLYLCIGLLGVALLYGAWKLSFTCSLDICYTIV